MEMGAIIKQERERAHLTQEELAEKLGLQKSAIAKYENGRVKNIKRSVIQKMAQIFNCDAAYLMGLREDEDESKPTYYLDPETAEIAQEIYDDPDLRLLFDAAKDSKPEDLRMAADMLKRFKGDDD